MNGFRYWLADLISGGELTRFERLARHNGQNGDIWFRDAMQAGERLNIADCRLSRIAALETPYANATVRKMAKIARGEV
jgi:hypothetical protein